MPTRLYFSAATASDVNPAFAAWTETDSAVRRKTFLAAEINEALALGTQLAFAQTATQLDRQYVSNKMDSGISFSGVTVKCQIAAREFATTDNSTSRLYASIVSEDGNTVRQVLLSIAQYGPNVEYISNASLRNKTFADGDTVAGTYTTVAGDRLVVEVGHATVAGSGTSPEAQCRFGAPDGTADHGENETETTSLVPWVEFSNTITFQAPAGWGPLLSHRRNRLVGGMVT